MNAASRVSAPVCALTSAGVPVDFVTIPGGDHGFTNPAHSQRAMELTVSWFERYLLKK